MPRPFAEHLRGQRVAVVRRGIYIGHCAPVYAQDGDVTVIFHELWGIPMLISPRVVSTFTKYNRTEPAFIASKKKTP